MGQVSGKLTISHVDHKTKAEPPLDIDGEAAQLVTTGQIVNGDVTNAPDLPSIDADTEPVAIKSNVTEEAAVPQTTEGEHGSNGSVHAAETHDAATTESDKEKEEKPAKKSKNPLVWIHRRLSKRSSASKKTVEKTTEEAAAAAAAPAPEEAKEQTEDAAASVEVTAETNTATVSATPVVTAEHQQVVETASSLVDQVLSSAMVQHTSEQCVEEPPVIEPVTTEVVEQQQHEPVPEPEVVEQPTLPVEQVVECAPVEHSQMHEAPLVEEATPQLAEVTNAEQEHVPEPEQETLPEPAPEAEVEPQPELPHQPEEFEKQPIDEQVESEQPILDTNNTNAECEEPIHAPETTEEQEAGKVESVPVEPEQNGNHVNGNHFEEEHDAMAAKLASLELTNGHHPATNGVNGTHETEEEQVVPMNGE